jgi:hypothetical protein
VPDVAAAYSGETETARSLALNRGKFWEFLLVGELMRTRLQALRSDYENFSALVKSSPTRQFTGSDFPVWIATEFEFLTYAMDKIKHSFDQGLFDAIGERGVPGDAIKILAVVDFLFRNCRRFLEFEVAVNAAEIPAAYTKLKDTFHGMTLATVEMMDDLLAQWTRNSEALGQGSQQFKVAVHLAMPQFNAARVEVDNIRKAMESSRS